MWHAEKAYTRFKAEATPVVAVQQLPFGYGAACCDRRVCIAAIYACTQRHDWARRVLANRSGSNRQGIEPALNGDCGASK